jgi:hypothetical protein
MARNIYSPLIISTISFFVLFILVVIIFTSTRFTDKYITNQVNSQTMMVSSINSKTETVNPAPKTKIPPSNVRKNTYTNTQPIQRQN